MTTKTDTTTTTTDAGERELWAVARDMGVSVQTLRDELEAERAVMMGVEVVDPRRDRDPLEAGQGSYTDEKWIGPRVAPASWWHSQPYVGRARQALAAVGHRTDIVVTATPSGRIRYGHALPTGTPAAAAARAKRSTATLAKLEESATAAYAAEESAAAGGTAQAIARAAARADVAESKLLKASVAHHVALSQHETAALWADVPECRPEIVVPIPARELGAWLESHTAPVDRIPARYRDSIRVHADRAPSDPTGDAACSEIGKQLAARDRAERALAARVAPAVAAAGSAARSAELASARESRKVAARRAKRAAARASK